MWATMVESKWNENGDGDEGKRRRMTKKKRRNVGVNSHQSVTNFHSANLYHNRYRCRCHHGSIENLF